MKKNVFNLTLLTAMFCLGLLTSNLFGGKLINILDFTVAGAIVTYPLTFLTTDIISEIWGKKEASNCVKIGIIVQIGFLVLGYLSLKIPSLQQTEHLQECLAIVLNQGMRLTLASLGAFMVSQTTDVILFHWLKEKTHNKHKWLRNNASTMCSQFIDTIIFIVIAFYGVVDNIWLMVFAQYLIKWMLAALDTPFFYFFTRNKK